jgi:hypothetical protein
MLFVMVGDDFEKKSKKTKEVLAGLKIKKPDAIFIHYDFLDLTEKKCKSRLKQLVDFLKKKIFFDFQISFVIKN